MRNIVIRVTPETLIDMTGRFHQSLNQLMRLVDHQKEVIQQTDEAFDGCEEITRYCEELQISMSHLLDDLEDILDFANDILATSPPSPFSNIIP